LVLQNLALITAKHRVIAESNKTQIQLEIKLKDFIISLEEKKNHKQGE
jgi:hypothetical protein